jgi:thiamine transporter ThiT
MVLSRLTPDQLDAAPPARPLTEAEKKRYDEIDKQVLREQGNAMAANVWARYCTPYYAPPVVYGGYGGYYRGWGVSYYSLGYNLPGWWW